MIRLKLIKNKMYKLKCGFEFPAVPLENLQEKEVNPTKEKQEIIADKEYSALSKVTVNPIPDEYIVPSGDINITVNGNYDVTEKANAIVNVPEKVLGTKTITQNGTYKATDDDLDGYSEVEVTTSGVDINDYFGDTIGAGDYNNGGWLKIIKKLRSPLTVSGTSAFCMFAGYTSTEIPIIDTSNVTTMRNMFNNCASITTIPQLNTQNVTNMAAMFNGCKSLTTIPQLNTQNVTNMNSMFNGCKSLTTIPQLNTQNVTDIAYMFQSCINLTTIPELNTQNVTRMSGMFLSCTNLTTIPELNTQNVTDIAYMFQNCKKIITLPKLNATKLINIQRFMYQDIVIGLMPLENFGGLENLGQAYLTRQSANYSNYKFDVSDYKKLTHDSLMNIINGLYDIASAGVKPQQLVLGSTNLAKLSDEEKAICTTKGWNLS